MSLELITKINRLKKLAASVQRQYPRQIDSSSLYSLIPTVAPKYHAPQHLDPLVQRLEASLRESVRVTAHAPPRHAKTDTVLLFIVFALLYNPELTIAYVTYEANTAKSKSRKARNWALSAGVQLANDASSLHEWRTTRGGGVLATGVGGPLTSQGVNILIIDDPYKNRQQAESSAYKAMVADWWGDVAETRIEPGGSAFIFHTRWVTDDLIGHVHASEDGSSWEHICMPAISNDGKALWPERWPIEALEQKRKSVGEYTWASLYQGEPRPRGGSLFSDVRHYDTVPEGYRVAIGIDLAYTKTKYADYSVAVVMAEANGKYYVLDVQRLQCKAPEFAHTLSWLRFAHPSADMVACIGGTETGVVDLLNETSDLGIRKVAAVSDKFVRAQATAASWNNGDIMLPAQATWLNDYVTEMLSFTGVRDDHDDQVDATVAAYDALQTTDYSGIIRVRSNRR